jgi:hypothetical protein
LEPPPRKAAPEVQNFLHLLVQHRSQRATLTRLSRSCSQHLLECPHWASLLSPEVALAAKECLRRTRRRFRASFRRTDICIFWRLGFRQSSFHLIARIARRAAPYAWTQPPLSWHALFPYCPFRLRLAIRFKNNPPSPSRLHREYNRAPRGAVSPYHADPPARSPVRLGTAAGFVACYFPLGPFGFPVSHRIQRFLLSSLPAARAIQHCASRRSLGTDR